MECVWVIPLSSATGPEDEEEEPKPESRPGPGAEQGVPTQAGPRTRLHGSSGVSLLVYESEIKLLRQQKLLTHGGCVIEAV